MREKKPKVIVGDTILLRRSTQPEAMWHRGTVHRVDEKAVTLRFGENFNTYKASTFDVQFVLNRMPYRRFHQAVLNVATLGRLLFPSEPIVDNRGRSDPESVFFNRNLAKNPAQRNVVETVLSRPPSSPPIVISGPCVLKAAPFR